jgi:glutaredoxin
MMVLSTSKNAAVVPALPGVDTDDVIAPPYRAGHKHLLQRRLETYARKVAARVILYTRRGCHLCADARPVVKAVCAEAKVAWEEVDAEQDPATAETYSELVPAVTVDGILRGFWRIDPEKLLEALR